MPDVGARADRGNRGRRSMEEPSSPVSKFPPLAPYTALLVDEFALLRAWQGGDAESGSQLLRRYTETLYHFFLTKTDPTSAEELTQATFEACTRHREQIHEAGSIRAYLFGIARKKVLQHRDEWRRRGARQDVLEHSVVANLTSPSVALARSQQQQLVLNALQRLPLDFQIAIELHYWEDMTVTEIARVLEVAPGTVKSRLYRARELLRDAIVALASHADLATTTVQGLEQWIASLHRASSGGSGDAV
jgi:RNA polymerase sigma factor (sigma-70 family)